MLSHRRLVHVEAALTMRRRSSPRTLWLQMDHKEKRCLVSGCRHFLPCNPRQRSWTNKATHLETSRVWNENLWILDLKKKCLNMLLKNSVEAGANILGDNCQQERGRYQSYHKKGGNFLKLQAILQLWIIIKWDNVGESALWTAEHYSKKQSLHVAVNQAAECGKGWGPPNSWVLCGRSSESLSLIGQGGKGSRRGSSWNSSCFINDDIHRPPSFPSLGSQHYARGGTLCHSIMRHIISFASPINLLR